MELLNRSIKALRGISDDPMSPSILQEDLSDEDSQQDQQRGSHSQLPASILENPAADIIIDFGVEERSAQPALPREPVDTRNQVIEEVIDPEELVYRKAIENIIKIALYGVLKWSTVGGLTFFLLIFTIKLNFTFLYILIFICLVDMYTLVNLLLNKSLINFTERGRYRFQILRNTLGVIAKISIVFYGYIKPFLLIYPLAPSLLFDCVYGLMLVVRYKRSALRKFYHIQFLLKAFTLILITSVALKMDNIIHWHWREVFASLWALLTIVVGVTFVVMLIFLNKFLNFFFADRRVYEIYGIIWLVYVFLGISTISCFFMFKLQKVLENKLSPNDLIPFLIVMTAYSILLSVFTALHFTKLDTFFRKLTVIEDEQIEIASPASVSPQEEQKPTQTSKKLVIPRFLAKSSGTFFRRVTQNDIEKTKAKPHHKEKKKTKPKVKPVKRVLQKSFDSGTAKNDWNNFIIPKNNPDLLTIVETDRDKLKTEALTTRKTTRGDDLSLKGLNSLNRKITEATLLSDRSKAGLIGSSHRSTVTFAAGEFRNTEDTHPTIVSARRKDGDKPDTFRSSQEGPLPGTTSPFNRVNSGEDMMDDKEGEGFSQILDEIGPKPLMKRRVNSLILLPNNHPELPEITESASYKENSRLEASEIVTSPTLEGSAMQQCLICFDKPPDAVYMECGHGGVCYECSLEIWKTTGECFLCRKKIIQVLQVDPKNRIGRDIIKVVSATQMVLCDNQNGNIQL